MVTIAVLGVLMHPTYRWLWYNRPPQQLENLLPTQWFLLEALDRHPPKPTSVAAVTKTANVAIVPMKIRLKPAAANNIIIIIITPNLTPTAATFPSTFRYIYLNNNSNR